MASHHGRLRRLERELGTGGQIKFELLQALKLLHERALQATAPRLAVFCMLAEAQNPLSHTEVLERFGETDWDPATISIYRNLMKLRDAGVAPWSAVLCDKVRPIVQRFHRWLLGCGDGQ